MAYKSLLSFTAIVGLLNLHAVASPLATPVFTPDLIQRCVAEGYATFYDDNACTVNGGQAVSIGNDGCLANEIGRNSVYIQAPCVDTGGPSMVWSPDANCGCQNHCAAVPSFDGGANGCWNLAGNPGASSFRFIEQDCGGDNC